MRVNDLILVIMVRGGFDLPEFTHWRVMPYSQMPFISSLICVKESLVSRELAQKINHDWNLPGLLASVQRKAGVGNNWIAKVFGNRKTWEVVLDFCSQYFTHQLSVLGPRAGSFGDSMCEEGDFYRNVPISWVLVVKPILTAFLLPASFPETPDPVSPPSPTPSLSSATPSLKAGVIHQSLIQFLRPLVLLTLLN